ncbi:hypothetical protein IC582_011626 [Cucumis melo]
MGSSGVRVGSSFSDPNCNYDYDVFFSFRGEDTRSNFISHLHMALRLKEVNVFTDDKLKRGEQISESLLKSIERSRLSLVIFLKDYASSTWCLDELVKIIECKKSKGQAVLPVFYKVDPSEVRKQTDWFGEALAKHEANKLLTNKIQPWKEALTFAAGLSGWDLANSKDEAELIQEIVKRVLSIVNPMQLLHVAKHPVGVNSRLRKIEELVSHIGFEGVNMVGMYGIGGIGKTTLAKALYNKIATQFEGCCFLLDVRREASKHGLIQLQKTLLNEILKEDLKVVNCDKGINIIRSRLCSKKVLIVLDDVDHRDQLEALVGERDWFCQGSKIIVTTRNKHLLSSHGFDEIHNILGLNEDKAIELFSWHAFKKNHPSSNYLDLSERVTSYCKGHPLALVVLGSFLCNRDQVEWCSILDEFENSLNKDIKDILQLSFDGLEDKVKDIFLDISCLLVGEKVEYVKDTLSACHVNLDFGIIVLMDLSLITIENDKVQMHDLIKQMGHKLVCGESLELGKRSRLWLEKDVLEVFSNNSGTSAMKAIKLEFHNPTRLIVDPQAFRNLNNLRLLIVRNARFCAKIKYLPESLKWIESHGFSQPSLPSHFIEKNLVGLDLQHSFIKDFGNRLKVGEWLKHVNLSYSTSLKKIPDFSAASNLEKLYLRDCTNLRTIHRSIFCLVKLTLLCLSGCCMIKKLPTSCFKLWSLKHLDLSGCTKLEKIPDFSSALNLEILHLSRCTNLRTIHNSVFSLHKLISLDLDFCSTLKTLPTSCFMLTSLNTLTLYSCKKLEEVPDLSSASNLNSLNVKKCTNLRGIHESIGSLDRLQTLVSRECTNLVKLPSILRLKSLKHLDLFWCSKLESIPIIDENMKSLRFLDLSFTAIKDLPSSIGYLTELPRLNLGNCTSLISLPKTISLLMSLLDLELRNCRSLQEIPKFPQNIQNLDAYGCELLTKSPDNIVDIISKKQDLTLGEISREFLLMGVEIPKWFSYKTTSNLVSASFRHYSDMERTLAACVSFKVNGDSSRRISCNIFICNRFHCSFSRPFLPSKSEYMWLVTTSLAWGSLDAQDWNKVVVLFEVDDEVNLSIRSYGVHVTEEFNGTQTDVKWPVVNYGDFYQPEKLQNLDIEDILVKRLFDEFSYLSNCKAVLHAGSYDPIVITDSNIQPMIFPLHVTYSGYTVISGMEGMGKTALANSLRNKFKRKDNSNWGQCLDDPSSFYLLQGRKSRRFSGYASKRRIYSKRYYYITFENLDVIEAQNVNAWFTAQRWIICCSPLESLRRCSHFVITSVDPSLWHTCGVDDVLSSTFQKKFSERRAYIFGIHLPDNFLM